MSKLPPKSRANKSFAVPPPPPSDQQRQRQKRKRSRSCLSIFALLVISLYFVHYYWKSSPPDDRQARAQAASLLASLESQLGSYIAWLNGTNSIDFTLPSVSDEQTKIIAAIQPPGIVLNSTEQSYFSNVTGRIRAEATVYNLSTPPTDVVWAQDAHALMAESKMNSTEVAHKLGQWNWKAVGRVALDVLKKRPDISPDDDSEAGMEEAEQMHMERIVEDTPDIVPIEGHVKLTDRLTEDEFKLKFSGVHFVSNGSIVAIAHPVASALDIRTLPAFVPPSVRNATAHALLPVLYAQIDALRERVSSPTLSSPSSSFLSSPTTPASTCTFTVYAQLAPSNITAEQMAEFEAETTHPTGAHVVDRPNLLADFTLVSPECGVLIVVEKAEKSRYWEMFSRKVAPYVGFSTLVHFSLLVLLLREMVRTSKAASLAGIARWTIVTQIFADELSLGSHAMFPIYFKRGPLLLVPAFLSLLLFLLEVLFAMIIMTVQGHEDAADRQAAASGRGVRAWLVRMVGTAEAQATSGAMLVTTPAQARGDSKSDAPDANAGALAEHSAYTFPPLPAAPTQRPSFLRQFWYDLCTDRDSQISLVLIFAIFILTRYINVPHVTDLAFCALYLSIWTPQIFRSISQGRRCAFSGEYMIGTTICRLVYAMYFVACPKNLLDIEPQGWIYTLALAMFAQVGFITLQKIRGPAFFLPKRYGPSSAPYNYHPLLAPGPGDIDIEAGRADSLGDCGICKDAIRYDAKVLEGKAQEKETAYGARKRRILAQFELALGPQKSYSLAPCHHIFHTDCLEKWLVTKTACPQCKRPLPPL